jgi:hypothetical protein
MVRSILTLLCICFYFNGLTQKDSTEVKIDSVLTSFHIRQDSLLKAEQDSIFDETLDQNKSNLQVFVTDELENKGKPSSGKWIRIGIGVLILVIVLMEIMRRRKLKG